MVEVPYKGYVFLLDEEDAHYIYDYNWTVKIHKRVSGDLVYLWVCPVIEGIKTYIYLHRLIMGLPPYKDNPVMVDHINCNTLDNRRCNLRLANKQQNGRNSPKKPSNISGYKGVSVISKAKVKKYQVDLCIDGKNNKKGRYSSAERAAHVYDWWAIKLYGEFAYLNFPEYDYSKPENCSFLSYEDVPSSANPLGEKYVYWCKGSKRWEVRITYYKNGKRCHKNIGTHSTLDDAVSAKYKWLTEHKAEIDGN